MVGQVLGINKIMELIPYRYPMLLVDRLYVESETKYIGLKNLTINELFFQGHFPGHPIMPGVLQVEAMEQVAEIAVGKKLDPSGKGDIYIKSLKRVKFRKPNNPGDRILIEVEIKKIENNEAEISASIRNNSGVTCQANIVLSVRDKVYPDKMPQLFTEFDKTENIAMDVTQIMSLLPHRYPFLLVDNIISVIGTHVVAVKNTTYNEPIFRGYTPDYAVLSGAIQSEIVAQCGCASVLMRPGNQGKLAYYMSIDEAEFYHPVHPGDQLVCEVDLPEGKSRFGRGDGFIKVGDKVVSRTAMTFALISPETAPKEATE